MKEQVFIELNNGEFLRGRKALANLFKGLTGRFTVTIEKTKRKRSNNQNRFFHGILTWYIQPALIDVGWNEARSVEWVKEFVKSKVLIKEYVNMDTGEITTQPGKTSELTTSEFMDMIAEIQQWGAEYLNINIPSPNEQVEVF